MFIILIGGLLLLLTIFAQFPEEGVLEEAGDMVEMIVEKKRGQEVCFGQRAVPQVLSGGEG